MLFPYLCGALRILVERLRAVGSVGGSGSGRVGEELEA